MDTHAVFMDPFTISLITAVCSFIGTIFIMETHPVTINNGIIAVKALSVNIHTGAINMKTVIFSIKDLAAMVIIAAIGTILTIITVNNLGVLQ
jgi:hypothetical protein